MEVMEVGEVIARKEVNFGVAPSHAPLRVLRLMPTGYRPSSITLVLASVAILLLVLLR